jgi:hypothetical protein
MKATLTSKDIQTLKEHEYHFFKYIGSDKSIYKTAQEAGFEDKDNHFLVDDFGRFLMNINFIFIGTSVFNEVAKYYEENKHYCSYRHGTLEYKEFWRRETHRRTFGMTANCRLNFEDLDEYYNVNTSDRRRKELLKPLHITGDYYNFLNYGRIYRALREEEKAQYSKRGKIPKKKYGFPNFMDGQWWNFTIDQFIYNNGFHLCKSKARRKGFSYMRGSQASNTVNLNKNVTIGLAAYDLKYLTDPGATSDMVKRNLDWYETQTYWSRGYLSEQLDSLELGYKRQKEANKRFGWRSKVLSVGCRANESALVGKDTFEVDFEEAGKFPNLKEVLDVTTSTAEDGDTQVGTIRIYGTGGTKDSNWFAFSEIYFNPEANDMMPFANVWDDNLIHTACGFFYPQVWGYGTYMDEHGNSLLLDAYEHDKNRKEETARKVKSESEVTIFISQRANRPSEAFLNTNDNLFASKALDDHIIRVKYDTDMKFWQDGMVIKTKDGYQFKTNEELKKQGEKVYPYIEEFPIKKSTNIRGCLRIFYPPYTINGVVPKGIYLVTSDSAGIDKDKKLLTIKHSLNSFKVWQLDNNITPNPNKRLVASYAGRFDTLKENDEILKNTTVFYNGDLLPEVNRGETITNFKSFGEISRILKDPKSFISKGRYLANAGLGISIGDGDSKMEGLRMLKELLYTVMSIDELGNKKYFLHYIYDLPFLLELQNYNLLGNFDRVSDAIVAAYQFRIASLKEEKERNKPKRKNNYLLNTLMNG